MEILSEEVWRIITTQYAVSLQRLASILGGLQQHQLRRWASGRCDLEALAVAILENLQQSPFALAILRKLSCILTFRDAVLEREPNLLQTLLAKANASDRGYEQHASACVALLSLPSSIPVPAEVSSFFATAVQRVIDTPSTETIRSVHLIISGVGAYFLESLSSSSLSRLQGQLIQIVFRLDKDNHDTNTFCLAILAQMASVELSTDLSSSTTSNTSGESAVDKSDRFEPARKLFADKNIPKILDFVFGRARWACSLGVSVPVARRIEVLKLCQMTIEPSNQEARQRWLSSRSSLSKKILEHVNREELDAEVRHTAIDFIAAAYSTKPLPEEMKKPVSELMQARSKAYCSRMLVEHYIAQLDERSLAADLLQLLQLAVQEHLPSQRGLSELDWALKLVKGFAAKCSISRDVRQRILYLLSTNEFSNPLQRFLDFVPALVRTEHNKTGVCPRFYAHNQYDFHRQLCCLILQTGLHAGGDELNLDVSLATALLKKNFDIVPDAAICSIFQSSRSTSGCTEVSLFEAKSTPQQMPSRQWREQLAKNLSRDAAYQQEIIMKTINEVCLDLEARCENAEQPFREEQARSRDLQLRLDEAETQNTELIAQSEKSRRAVKTLEEDSRRLAEQVDAANERSEALLADLRNLQKEVENTKKQATSAAEASLEAARQQELTFLAIIQGRDEEFQKKSDQAETLEAQISDLNIALADCRDREATYMSQIERLQGSLDQRSHDLGQAEGLAAARLAEMDQLKAVNTGLAAEATSANTKTKEAMEKCQTITSELEAQALAFESEKSTLHSKLTDLALTKTSEIEKLNQGHEATLRQLRKNHDHVQKNLQRAAKQSCAKVKDLEKKVSFLRCERDDQANVIAEYQDFNYRITSRLRTRQPPSDSPGNSPIGLNDSQAEIILRDEEQMSTQNRIEEDRDNSFGSSTSGKSSGPTPKRTRTESRRACKPPTTAPRRASHAQTARRATSAYIVKGQRQVLRSLGTASQNATLSIPTQPLTQKSIRRHTDATVLQNLENEPTTGEAEFGDVSFDDSNIFTSTSEQRLTMACAQATRNDYDETTADI